MGKLVYGVGINDADYSVNSVIGSCQVMCPYYDKWKGMLRRCYSKKYHNKQPTYINCTVCEEWLTFSTFKRWMETQDWQDKHLDKDLLCKDNKVYSAIYCVFVSQQINSFLTDRVNNRGEFLIGVDYISRLGKFRASCSDGKRTQYLGLFNTELEAHLKWKAKKHTIACELATSQEDTRISKALRTRYL